ncbi:hypothetical protein [Clostridium sp. AWRP]|uniref:hypothetical protein n=1 Tax=Clostridium sp. AWRP TaxID=2212991 RepID=UPI000FDC8B14|nr:hypothetical protein [Clostridium sp. AWRP]AZV58380.1 hypothetical protein DMR38_18295 [Clostridium sp. AWRP]
MDKIRPYIKLDLEIAKMEIENKQVEACFGRYIAYKENLQRISKKNFLPRGQFYLTARGVYEDLNLSSTREASRLIKLFESHGIIRSIFKSNSKKKPSIYSYITAETVNETVNETDGEMVKALRNKVLHSYAETVIETDNETKVETSKKEYIKRNNKKNINSHFKNDKKYLEIFNYWNSKKIITHKKLTKDMENAIDKALKTYSDKEIRQAIYTYSQVLQSDFYFNYKWSLKDFLNRKNGISTFMDEGTNKCNYDEYLKSKQLKEKNKSNSSNECRPNAGAFQEIE